mgnify:FL=1
MPKAHADEHGVKGSRAKKSDKARRNFDLHGAYTAKHLRVRQEEARRRDPVKEAAEAQRRR